MIKDDDLPNLLNDVIECDSIDELYRKYQVIVNSTSYGNDKIRLGMIAEFLRINYIPAMKNYKICEQFKSDYDKESLGTLMIFKKMLIELLSQPNEDYKNYMRYNNGRGIEQTKQ